MKIVFFIVGAAMVMWSIGVMSDRHPNDTGKAIVEALPHVRID